MQKDTKNRIQNTVYRIPSPPVKLRNWERIGNAFRSDSSSWSKYDLAAKQSTFREDWTYEINVGRNNHTDSLINRKNTEYRKQKAKSSIQNIKVALPVRSLLSRIQWQYAKKIHYANKIFVVQIEQFHGPPPSIQQPQLHGSLLHTACVYTDGLLGRAKCEINKFGATCVHMHSSVKILRSTTSLYSMFGVLHSVF